MEVIPKAWESIDPKQTGSLTSAQRLVLFPNPKVLAAFDQLSPENQERAVGARLRSLKANAAALEISGLVDQRAARIIESDKPVTFPRRVMLNLVALPILTYISVSALAAYYRTTEGTRASTNTSVRATDKPRLALPGTIVARQRSTGGNWLVHYAFAVPPTPAPAAAFTSAANSDRLQRVLDRAKKPRDAAATVGALPEPILTAGATQTPLVERIRNTLRGVYLQAWYAMWSMDAPPISAIHSAADATIDAARAVPPAHAPVNGTAPDAATPPTAAIAGYVPGARVFISNTITSGYPAGPTEFHPAWPSNRLQVGDRVTVLVPAERLAVAARAAAQHAGEVDATDAATRAALNANPRGLTADDVAARVATGKVPIGDPHRPIPITDCCLSDRPPFVRISLFVLLTAITAFDTWRRVRAYQLAFRLDQSRARGEWPFNNASIGAMSASLKRDVPLQVRQIFDERVSHRVDELHKAATKAIEASGGDMAKARALLESSKAAPRALLEERNDVVEATRAAYRARNAGLSSGQPSQSALGGGARATLEAGGEATAPGGKIADLDFAAAMGGGPKVR